MKEIDASDPALATCRTVKLRLLATSDLHMQITSFDYIQDRHNSGGSLAKLATLMEQARREAQDEGRLCLLFDNGDTLQGNPMADVLAESNLVRDHPMVACMNALSYDAGGLGNHDIDFGLTYLDQCLRQHKMPVICTNLDCNDLGVVKKSVVLSRDIAASDGTFVTLKIGVLSSLPDKTAAWSRHHLSGRARLEPPLVALKAEAERLKATGVDLVFVLAHMGIAFFDEGDDAQNLISEVAKLGNIDAVIGGHTHLRFPGPDHENLDGIDNARGCVWNIPVVQPGVSGSDLGQIDLTIEQPTENTPWLVSEASARLVPATHKAASDSTVEKIQAPAHVRVRQHLAKPAAAIGRPMNTFFALAEPSPVVSLMAAAKYRTIERAVAGSSLSEIPLIAAASANLTGGFDGPDNFIALEAGEVQARHVAGMTRYANQVWAVRASGARLLDWLERSAVIFNTLKPNTKDQMLINPHIPGFRYDALYGLDYEIDLSRDPLYSASGRRLETSEPRVKNVMWQGKPLDPEAEFLVATTDHRVGGGGLYQQFSPRDVIVSGQSPIKDALIDYLKEPDCKAVRSARPWRLVHPEGAEADLLTAPQAIDTIDDIAHLQPEAMGQTDDGFLRLKLRF